MRYPVLVAAGIGLLFAAGAQAQGPAPADAATNAYTMPGDYFDISQSAQLKVPLGPPPGPSTQPPHKSPAPVTGPAFDLALEAAQAAIASCRADGYTVTVAVTDSEGNLKAALSPDGARTNGVYMAMHKAVTVVGFKMSTLELRQRIEKDSSLMAKVRPSMSLLPGGLPIVKGNTFIGAIATSGASAYEEEKCAQAGIARIASRL